MTLEDRRQALLFQVRQIIVHILIQFHKRKKKMKPDFGLRGACYAKMESAGNSRTFVSSNIRKLISCVKYLKTYGGNI